MNDDFAQEIKELLNTTCKKECKVLAPSVIDEISRGRPRSEFINPVGGAYMDLTSVIAIVTTAANLALALLRLREELVRKRADCAPEPQMLQYQRDRILIAEQNCSSLADEKRRALIEAIFPEFRR